MSNGHFANHRGIGVLDYYPDAEQFIVVLRDPFETLVSLYFYLRKHNAEYMHDGRKIRLREEFGNFAEFFEHRLANPGLGFAQLFSSYLPVAQSVDVILESFGHSFVHVGIFEYLQRGLDLLADKLDKPPVALPHVNISELEKLRTRHVEAFPLEYEVYCHAVRIHDREAAGASSSRPAKVLGASQSVPRPLSTLRRNRG